MVRVPRDLLDRLSDHPIPVEAVAAEDIEALRESGATITESDGSYHLEDLSYGGASVALALDQPYAIEWRDSVDSTNRLAREIATNGERDVLVLAAEQTGGRGRRDRVWSSPRGGIWLSVLTTPSLPSNQWPLLTLAAAVAVVEATQSTGLDPAIKWPNDLLAPTGEKLAGVLAETGRQDGNPWAVIGVGLNADVAPDALPPGATSLRSFTDGIDRTDIVARLVEILLDLSTDPGTIRDRWRTHATTLNRPVRIQTDGGDITGVAVEITDTGALVIDTDGGRRTVSIGECAHLDPRQ